MRRAEGGTAERWGGRWKIEGRRRRADRRRRGQRGADEGRRAGAQRGADEGRRGGARGAGNTRSRSPRVEEAPLTGALTASHRTHEKKRFPVWGGLTKLPPSKSPNIAKIWHHRQQNDGKGSATTVIAKQLGTHDPQESEGTCTYNCTLTQAVLRIILESRQRLL